MIPSKVSKVEGVDLKKVGSSGIALTSNMYTWQRARHVHCTDQSVTEHVAYTSVNTVLCEPTAILSAKDTVQCCLDCT